MLSLHSLLALVATSAPLVMGGPPVAAEGGTPAVITVLSRAEVGRHAVATAEEGTVVAARARYADHFVTNAVGVRQDTLLVWVRDATGTWARAGAGAERHASERPR